MRLMWGFGLSTLALFMLGETPAAHANFISNPGLTPSVKVQGLYDRGAKSKKQPLAGWTVTGAIDIAKSKYWQSTGTSGYSVDLIGAPGLGAIEQTITGLTVGDTYSLSFDVA